MTRVISWLYQNVLRPILFLFDPELVHEWFLWLGERLGKYSGTRALTRYFFSFADERLAQKILGIDFPNPVGLAAGFDKDARLTDILPAVGFGFMEVGSITAAPCVGNPKPRLWRLIKSGGLVIYYGLKNLGVKKIGARLRHRPMRIPLWVSVAKTNSPDTVEVAAGAADYAAAYEELSDIGQMTVVNISCPNAFGGEPFTSPDRLEILLNKLDGLPHTKPVLIKFSPDLALAEVDALLAVIERHNIQGIICANLTKNRVNPEIHDSDVPTVGGISGRPLSKISDDLLAYIYKRTGGQYLLVGCGGVFTAADAYRKIRLGASLVQLITGMIFVGPTVVREINSGLVQLLTRDGFNNIREAVGIDACQNVPKPLN